MESNAIDLDVKTIIRYVSIAYETIGIKWLSRKLKEEKRRQKQDKLGLEKRKHTYLYRASPHPLVQWSIEAERWREACIKSRKMELKEVVLKLAILGKSLEQARTCKGFDRLKNRLKIKKQFYAAAFEAEIAASYTARNWDVEFVEEGNERSPDLKITRDDGADFWAECKCRDALTERDRNLNSFWKELESTLLRTLGPKKLNYAICIKALKDPEFAQLPALKNVIFDAVDKGGIGHFDIGIGDSKIESVSDPTGNFLFSVTKLVDPDEEINTTEIGFQSSENFDRVVIVSEVKTDTTGDTRFRNPIIIALKNVNPSDKVTGIIHGFKSAVGQLPQEGPGVIWIRIPDNAWSDNIDQSFKQAEDLLRAELKGTHNQRVNVVFLMTRVFQKLEKDGQTGLSYKPLKLAIEHENPRQPVTTIDLADTA